MQAKYFQDVRFSTVQVTGGSLTLPILYHETELVCAMFSAPVKRLKKILPSENLVPTEIFPGQGIIGVLYFDQRDCTLKPYNESNIVILARYCPTSNIPFFSYMQQASSGNMESYTWKLPVSSEEALNAGKDIWGYDKFIADNEIIKREKNIICRTHSAGKHIFSLEVDHMRQKPSPGLGMNFTTFTVKDNELLCCTIRSYADTYGMKQGSSAAKLFLGDHPLSDQLRDLQIGKCIAAMHVPKQKSILYPPELRLPL